MSQPNNIPVALPHEWDNRDTSETWIWIGNIESGIRIEVSPYDLYRNMIENNIHHPDKQAELLKKFRDLHTDIEAIEILQTEE